MTSLLNILYILLGAVAVLWGADRFTDGASALARRLNVPQIVIGLTVVAFGTSAPEFFVSLVSAIGGTGDMAVGNIVGSNIFNVLLITGLSAAIAPIAVTRATVRKDIPWAVGASALLLLLCIDGNISRLDGGILFVAFAAFMVYTLRMARQGSAEAETEMKEQSMAMSVVWTLVGLVCLVVGSNLFVSGARGLAEMLGVSDAIIGLTIVAGGTSLPELATSVVAARKGQSGLAIGNVIGSNVFNILFILGVTGLVRPMQTGGITMVDYGVMLLSILLMWLMCRTKYRVSRSEGAVMLALFVAYIAWLVINA